MKHRTLAALFAAALAAHGYSADDAKSRTDAFLRNEMETGRLDRMSVAYEQHGETRYTFMAGPGSDQPMHVASITKTVTAVLVMQLAEEGKLCLNDYVKKYVPLFPAEDVTILHLMTHTSGWRNKTGHSKQPGRAEEFYGTMFKEFEPGEKFRYMSQGYDILAEIVEKLTGVDDVADVAKSRVFEPLGMDGTNLAPHQGQAGMNTTAADLVKFGRELLDIQKKRRVGILLPESVDALFHPVLKPEFNRTPGFFRKSGATGFGQYFCELNSFDAMSHSGATGCNFLIDPGRDAVEVILSGTHDWKNEVFRRCDGHFSRVNAVMMANFGDHVAPVRPIKVGSAKVDQCRAKERELQALLSRQAAGEAIREYDIQRLRGEIAAFKKGAE